MIKLQQANYIRPYHVSEEKINGVVDTIIMYDDNGEIFKTRGWFEATNETGRYATGDVREIQLNNLTKRNKVSLTRKENFVTGLKDAMTLYIYVDNKNVSVKKVKTIKVNFNQEYLLQTSIHNYNFYHVIIGDIDFYTKIFNHCDKKEHEGKENANKL